MKVDFCSSFLSHLHLGGWEAFREPPNPSKCCLLQLIGIAEVWSRSPSFRRGKRKSIGIWRCRGEARRCCCFCKLVVGDGEGGGSREEEVFEGVADMDSEEGQDGHSLRLHPSHHLHRHADRTQASTIAASEPCLNWKWASSRGGERSATEFLHEVCNAHIVSILHIALCLLKCARGSFLWRQELRPGACIRQDDSFETRFYVVSEFMWTITESPMNRYCAEVGWALLVFFRILLMAAP